MTLNLNGAEVVPGEELSLTLLGDLDQPIVGYQVGIQFPAHAMTLQGASLKSTDLEDRIPVIFDVSIGFGYGTIKVFFSAPIPAGDAVRLTRLEFKMVRSLSPGSEYQVELRSGLGFPPLPSLIYTENGSVPPAGLGSSTIRVVDQNVLRIRDLRARPNEVENLEFRAFNVDPIEGFSIAAVYDPTILRFINADISDTITEAVGAEFVAPIIDNESGIFILGVLLDIDAPFENQMIPATGSEQTIAKALIQVVHVPPGVRSAEVELVDGLGTSQIWNIFSIRNKDVEPVKKNGLVELITEGEFLRGDVNGDGVIRISDPAATCDWLFRGARELICHKAADVDDNGEVDISDVIYSMHFMFLDQAPPPPPWPTPGLDPTPDDLPCPPN